MIKPTIATILGTAALGLIKKHSGSTIRLSTIYRYSGAGYFDVHLDECLKAIGVEKPVYSTRPIHMRRTLPPDLDDVYPALTKIYDATKCDTISPSGIKISINLHNPESLDYRIIRRLKRNKAIKDCYIAVLFDFTFNTPNQINNVDEENFLQEELSETVKSTFLHLLREGGFESSVLSEWSKLENWGPAQLADGHWFSYGKTIIINADTGEEYKPPERTRTKLRKR